MSGAGFHSVRLAFSILTARVMPSLSFTSGMIEHKVTRVEASGYPVILLLSVAKSFQETQKNSGKHQNDRQQESSPVTIAYVHRTTHNRQKCCAQSYDVRAVFSLPSKLVSL